MYCFENHFVSIEFVEALERIARKWSAFQWRRAAYLCGLAYNFVEDSKLARLPLPAEYRVSRKLGSIAAQIVQVGDKVAIRVYAISFGDGPFKPGRYLHRLAGRGYIRETFHICGVGRTKRVFEGFRVPWRHIPRNDSGANENHEISGEEIRFASSALCDVIYSFDARTLSENAKHWAPNGSLDISLGNPIEDAHADRSVFERNAAISLARSQPSYSLGKLLHAKGSDRFDDNITIHDVLKGDYNIVANAGIIAPMLAETCVLDIDALETAQLASPPWMRTPESSRHTVSRSRSSEYLPPRTQDSPRPH